MLEVRESSPLFRLQTAAEVQERLAFHNTGPDQIPGLIVMTLDDPARRRSTTGDLDPDADRLAVLFNPTDEAVSYTIDSWAGEPSVALHPVLAASADDVVGAVDVRPRRPGRSPCRRARRRCSSTIPTTRHRP